MKKRPSVTTLTKRKAAIEGHIAAFRMHEDAASAAGDHRGAVAARDKVASQTQDLHRVEHMLATAEIDDPVAQLRGDAELAKMDGSYVAAINASKAAAQLEMQRAELEQRRRESELSDLTAEELLGMMLDAVAKMPADHAAQLRAALEARGA